MYSPPPLPPGLMLVHGNHPESLRELLVTWMRRYPLAPLETETILVHSNGIAQWLRLALAESEGGIAAGLDLSLPSRFLWQAYRAVLGEGAVPETSPFDKPLLIWRLMRLLPELTRRPAYAPLRRFLAADADQRKRFQLAERLADLFDQYQVYRADWLAAWAEGEDVLIRADGSRPPLPAEQAWQASLWRDLLADVAAGGDAALAAQGRAAVHEAFLAKAAAWPEGVPPPAGLPRRVLVFGISALPRQSLEALAAVARWSQVLMGVHNPCEHFWADIVADQDLLRASSRRQARRAGAPPSIDPDTLHLHAHPLLAAWGKQGRDFIGLLDEHDSEVERARYRPHFSAIRQRIDLFASPGEACLLHQLQDDIRDLRPLAESRARWPAVAADDDSIRFHIAHSPLREVEILHDALLAAFNADPALRPRDVIVMVPDIDAFAPHIQAVFGLLSPDDPRYIPFCIADQGRRQQDPLLQALARLLELPVSRLGVGDVLDLLEVPALRQRFGIAEDQLPLLQRWIRGAQVRWGLHGAHKASFGLPDTEQNSWRFGLRRMLLGYAVGAAGADWHDIEPYEEIGGLDAALLGPLVQLLDQLDASWQQLAEPATPEVWVQRLRTLLAACFAATDEDDAYTLEQLDLALGEWLAACTAAGLDSALPLTVVAEHWLAGFDTPTLSQRFFAGAVTFATLMPMRAIPFRQVCLLGMNDGDYPRSRPAMDFDLMGRNYRPGDRSRREDDRYLFLEALLSARQRLHISWVGRSIADNSPRPPSVLVGQLRDHLAAGWELAGQAGEAGALLAALTLEHRLQPFNPDYFPAEKSARLFTYSHEWQPGVSPAPVSPVPLPLSPSPRSEPLRLADLADFLRDPVRAFFRQRLKVDFSLDDPVSADQEPFALDGLEMWQLWDELIAAQVRALDADAEPAPALAAGLERIRRRGQLAGGAFADLLAERLAAPMPDLFERYQAARSAWPALAPELAVHYGDPKTGLVLEDRLGGLRQNAAGEHARLVLESSDLVKNRKYRHHVLLRHWVSHLAGNLALHQADADSPGMQTLVIAKVGSVTLPPLDKPRAEDLLAGLLDAWWQGQTRPLPLAVKTAFAWLDDQVSQRDTAPQVYEGGYNMEGELGGSPYLQRAWPSYAALLADGDFGRWAKALLQPLMNAVLHKEAA